MKRPLRTSAALLAAWGFVASATAGPIPSRAESRTDELARVESVLDHHEVARTLAASGLTRAEVEERLARLSPEDLAALAANVDRVQAAGEVPGYIWILLAALIVVTILAMVF